MAKNRIAKMVTDWAMSYKNSRDRIASVPNIVRMINNEKRAVLNKVLDSLSNKRLIGKQFVYFSIEEYTQLIIEIGELKK